MLNLIILNLIALIHKHFIKGSVVNKLLLNPGAVNLLFTCFLYESTAFKAAEITLILILVILLYAFSYSFITICKV